MQEQKLSTAGTRNKTRRRVRRARAYSRAKTYWLAHGPKKPTVRSLIYEIIEGGQGETRLSLLFDLMIVALIIINVAAVVLDTVPSIHAAHGPLISQIEYATVSVFTVEYILRLWTAVEAPFLNEMRPWKARFVMATRPGLIIDFLAILPYYLAGLLPDQMGVLRVLRLLRFLKLARYSLAMHTLFRVLQNEAKALLGASLLLIMAILFSATLIYNVESAAQPDKFGSIPQAAWWSMATLTTVGYGDVVPITTLGRLVAGLTMVMGLCVLALPVAIISTGFAQELQRRDFVVTWSMMSRVPILSGLEAKQAAEIMPLLQAQYLPPNAEVVSKGAQGDAMYFVASGKVEFNHDERRRTFSTGEFFGARAMLENNIHAGSFVTTTKTRLLKLERDDFHRIEVKAPNVAAHIRKIVELSAPISPSPVFGDKQDTPDDPGPQSGSN